MTMSTRLSLLLVLAFAFLLCVGGFVPIEAKKKKGAPSKPHLVTQAVASFALGTNQINGTITFEQSCLKGYVMVTVNLNGLNQNIGVWDVHTSPASTKPGVDPCSTVGARLVGLDNRQDGALSDRLGSFQVELQVFNRNYLDNSILLNGPTAITGRSLVLHRVSDGSKFVCVNILATKHS